MTTQAKHTPGSAHYGALNLTDRLFVAIQDNDNPEHTTLVCEIPPYIGNEANAARLAHCWNHFDPLLEALQDIAATQTLGRDIVWAVDRARAAIQAATS